MNRRRPPVADAPGQDSFLDIVANLVGILIILVMVIGVRAKDVMLEATPAHEPAEDPTARLAKQLKDANAASDAVEADIHRIDGLIKRQQLDIDYRREERDRVLLLVKAAEEQIAERREELDETQRAKFDAEKAILDAEAQLEDLQEAIGATRNAAARVGVVEHLPTPMVKTVFGNEVHFQLRGGRLTYIPWDELVERLQQDAQEQLWRMKEQAEFTRRFGPIGGFWLEYTLVRVEETVDVQVGTAVRKGVQLDRFILLPVSDELGEPFSEALREKSDFRARLAEFNPDSTTVTVWTYPDSFDQFRTLKQELFRLGYLTASRPLPEDQPIGGSPHGTHSVAQ